MFVSSARTYNHSNYLKQQLKDTKLFVYNTKLETLSDKMFNLFYILEMSVTIFFLNLTLSEDDMWSVSLRTIVNYEVYVQYFNV